MKRCPTCNKTFTDRNLSFCIDDGTPLVSVDTSDEVTLVSPSHEEAERGSTGPASTPSGQSLPPYQPPGAYVPRGTLPGQPKRKVWPWVVGILALVLLLLAGLGIVAAILIPNMIRASSNRNTANTNSGVYRSDNYNSNLNGSNSNAVDSNDNLNDNSDTEDATSPPTDEEQVLADLTNLEHEWTVANINADKKKLDRILADDYVGTSDGKIQGKAEYLGTIERDTTIQKWDFEDLKVNLNGDRASLSGVLRLQVQDKPVVFRFTDKFVWRDGRWQATGSEVTQVQ